MKIHYLKRRQNFNLIIGTGYSIFSIAALIFDKVSTFNIVFLSLGIIYLSMYFFEKTNQYLTIKNGMITKHSIRPKRMKLDEIIQIKNFAGDYVLTTKQDELTINKSFIEKKSLLALEKVLQGLNLNADETTHAPSNLSKSEYL